MPEDTPVDVVGRAVPWPRRVAIAVTLSTRQLKPHRVQTFRRDESYCRQHALNGCGGLRRRASRPCRPGTLATAAWLGSSGRCLVIGLFAIYASGLFFAWYLAAMFSVPIPSGQPDTQDDLAAGGLIFLAVPTTVVVGFLACPGAGIGATVRALHQRRTSVARSA